MGLLQPRFSRRVEMAIQSSIANPPPWDTPAGGSVTQMLCYPNREPAAYLLALLLLQARKDRASEIRLAWDRVWLSYVIEGCEYEMVPAPMPVLVDLIREIVTESRMTDKTPGRIVLQAPDEQFSIAVEHAPERVIRLKLPWSAGQSHPRTMGPS